MFKYYFQSFNLRFKGRSSRREFVSVILIDMVFFIIMGFKLYLLHYGSSFPYLTFTRPIFAFFYPARWVLYLLGLTWFFARYAAWQALAVRRAHDLGKEDKWILVPFFKVRLFFEEGKKTKNQYGGSPTQT